MCPFSYLSPLLLPFPLALFAGMSCYHNKRLLSIALLHSFFTQASKIQKTLKGKKWLKSGAIWLSPSGLKINTVVSAL
jgi:hypothetical protein